MQAHFIDSIAELRRQAPRWNNLWLRSAAGLPTLCAEPLAQWLEHFAPAEPFKAICIEQDGELIAALPLVQARRGPLTFGRLPSNSWSASGDLLLDESHVRQDAALDMMVRALQRLPWPIAVWDEVEAESPRWKAFCRALRRGGLRGACRRQYRTGVVDILHDWDRYQAAWSGNHRHAVRKSLRKLEQEGNVELARHRDLRGAELDELLKTCFEIEDKSWKGAAGTSILGTAGMLDFFLRQARELARQGTLEIDVLAHRRRPIAFEYCFVAKGTCFSHKIGYDPAFGRFGPGRLLRMLQLERFHEEDGMHRLDTLGILCESKAKWCTRDYAVSRVVAGLSGFGGGLAFAYDRWWPRVQRLRGRGGEIECPPAGAARLLEDEPALA